MVINHNTKTDIRLSGLSSGEPLVFILSTLYFLVGILLIFESRRIFRLSKHDIHKSPLYFRLVILNLSTISMLWRGVLSFVTPNYNNLFARNIFETFLPLYFQYSSFLLFVFFYSFTLCKINYNQTKIRKLLLPLYVLLQIGVFAFGIISSAYGTLFDKKIDFFRLNDGNLTFIASVLTGMSLILAFFCWLSWKYLKNIRLTQISRNQLSAIALLMLINITIFVFNGIWDLCTLTGNNYLNNKCDQWYENNDQRYYWVYFFWYLVTDGFPSVSLLTIFHINISNEVFKKKELRTYLSEGFVNSDTTSLLSKKDQPSKFVLFKKYMCCCLPSNKSSLDDQLVTDFTSKNSINHEQIHEIMHLVANSSESKSEEFDPNDFLLD
ncbi:hypothetical protein M0812_19734 [Anaeramoeba flamelloides]|uniref:THH1/TOM1/TOM3 domain-containing protein n=1 Tax=Anaeramoeba flamelloides TaxID=1746091 RepID=A0AAV7Z3A1_9EUKA|nr:hypothetical protein M0812_19734 [Anaeramoeba flamelloides]